MALKCEKKHLYLYGFIIIALRLFFETIYNQVCPSLIGAFLIMMNICIALEYRQETLSLSPFRIWPDLAICWIIPYIGLRFNTSVEFLLPFFVWSGVVWFGIRRFTYFIPHEPIYNAPPLTEEVLSMPLIYNNTNRYRRLVIARQIATRMYHEVQQRAQRALSNFRVERFPFDISISDEAEIQAQEARRSVSKYVSETMEFAAFEHSYQVLKYYIVFEKSNSGPATSPTKPKKKRARKSAAKMSRKDS